VTQVVVGAISDELGLAASWNVTESRHAGRSFDVRKSFWACPADKFQHTQPGEIALEAGHHGPRIGTIRNLEHRGKLWVVAETDPNIDLTRQPWQLSYELVEIPDDGYLIDAVAVVEKSATVSMPDLDVRDGTLAHVAGQVVYQDGLVGSLIRNAHEDSRARKHGEPIEIRRATATVIEPDYAPAWRDYSIETRPRHDPREAEWRRHGPGAKIEWSRHVGKVLRVS
jgi:hypothetical protein